MFEHIIKLLEIGCLTESTFLIHKPRAFKKGDTN